MELLAADDGGEAGDLGVRELQEAFEEAELVEELEGGGVDGVAAEVAEEVFVLFEDGDGDAGAGEEEAEHDAGGASADDADGGGVRLRGGRGAHGGMRVAEGRDGLLESGAAALHCATLSVERTRYRALGRSREPTHHAKCAR